ncbi:hypothetical protein [Burkholderia multivorans]|uniref:hypothetical protein n=1 Tax=Burkholderia multivorans TaxID=87883 RepID=UPI001FC8B8A1|nr:hypothetical protein [Burkholderia multivorans]
MIDTEKMKALAMKVGGVEWYEAGDSVILPDGDTIACCQSSIGHMPEPIHYDDMVEYLVSVSPAKILALLSELEAAKLERDKMMKALAECRDKAHVEGYGKSFLYEAIACPDDVPAFIGQTVTELRAALEAREADRRRLSLELEGVIIDTEQGYGFDEVCLATVKRVRAALAQRQKGEEDERA